MKNSGSSSELSLPVSVGEIKRPHRNTTKFGQGILWVLGIAFIIFITSTVIIKSELAEMVSTYLGRSEVKVNYPEIHQFQEPKPASNIIDQELVQKPIPLGNIVILYSDPFLGGSPLGVILGFDETCFDLPDYFDDVTSSIKTYGRCAVLCENRGCGGRCETMSDWTRGADSFQDINFNDKVSSLKNCNIIPRMI